MTYLVAKANYVTSNMRNMIPGWSKCAYGTIMIIVPIIMMISVITTLATNSLPSSSLRHFATLMAVIFAATYFEYCFFKLRQEIVLSQNRLQNKADDVSLTNFTSPPSDFKSKSIFSPADVLSKDKTSNRNRNRNLKKIQEKERVIRRLTHFLWLIPLTASIVIAALVFVISVSFSESETYSHITDGESTNYSASFDAAQYVTIIVIAFYQHYSHKNGLDKALCGCEHY
mmetsp:Transcript_34161/g.66519  ORF Transcript_34161/g.66519 Transcript_34161/m.66519 type:complete len:229 (+) Transcript_34161:396-1082(+)